jgi:hypothetical protein
MLMKSLVEQIGIYLSMGEANFPETKNKTKTTFNGGSLGSCIDEERSEMRYVM